MSDPLDTPLPCDVDCGSVKFRKGVPLRQLVEAARRWNAKLRDTWKPTPESLSVFNSAIKTIETEMKS